MSSIRIEKVSIIDARTECIVNAANEDLQGGSGVCGVIFRVAGWDQLKEACDKIGHCNTGRAVTTPAFHLNAKYIIHVVGPIWQGGRKNEAKALCSCYHSALFQTVKNKCHSIALPLISAGIYGYPVEKAWYQALLVSNYFIEKYPGHDLDIVFAVIDDDVLQIGKKELARQREVRANPREITKNMTPEELITQWREEKKFRYIREWNDGWPAKIVETRFNYNGRKYTIIPSTFGLEDEDCWDQGFLEFLQGYLKKDLELIGATGITNFGFLD